MRAAATLEVESTLTDRYQTTVPDPIRRVLKLGKRDKIRYSVLSDGSVIVERVVARDENADPTLAPFLDFLARDIEQHPENLRAFGGDLHNRIQRLVGHIDVDLDAALSPDDE